VIVARTADGATATFPALRKHPSESHP
jgi:hypothetical protein